MKNICVIGVGYVGLVTGACFADLGNRVSALDINEERIEHLRQGIMPIYEPGLEEMVRRNVGAGRLSFTTSYAEALQDAEFVFIAVGTPSGVDGEADLQYVRMAAEAIAEHHGPPADHHQQEHRARRHRRLGGRHRPRHQPKPIAFAVVSCPEFLREGSALADFHEPGPRRARLARPRGGGARWRSCTCRCARPS